MIRLKILIVMFVAMLLSISHSYAHEITPSIATLKLADDRLIVLRVSSNLEALLAKIGPDHEDTDDAPTAELYKELRGLPSGDLVSRLKIFAPEFISNLGLKFDTGSPGLKLEKYDIPDVGNIEQARESIIVFTGRVPDGSSTFTWSFPAEYGTSVLRIERPEQEIQAQFFAAGATSDPFQVGVAEPRSWIAAAWDYMKIGYTHILPKGLDHILFVLGLFLLSTHWKPLFWQVTAFTLAHSVTLALGLYGVVNISPSIVEPLIALSIVYVAVENILTNKLHTWRPIIVFVFGLLHGLGFAGILTEIGIPRSDFVLGLISFNIGVELGQLTVILLAWLAVGWAMKRAWYRSRIVIPASLIIAAIGAYWFVERTFL